MNVYKLVKFNGIKDIRDLIIVIPKRFAILDRSSLTQAFRNDTEA